MGYSLRSPGNCSFGAVDYFPSNTPLSAGLPPCTDPSQPRHTNRTAPAAPGKVSRRRSPPPAQSCGGRQTRVPCSERLSAPRFGNISRRETAPAGSPGPCKATAWRLWSFFAGLGSFFLSSRACFFGRFARFWRTLIKPFLPPAQPFVSSGLRQTFPRPCPSMQSCLLSTVLLIAYCFFFPSQNTKRTLNGFRM